MNRTSNMHWPGTFISSIRIMLQFNAELSQTEPHQSSIKTMNEAHSDIHIKKKRSEQTNSAIVSEYFSALIGCS